MKTRIITALFIIAVVFFPVVYGSWALEALAVFIICSGAYEWLHALDGFKTWGIGVTILEIVLILAMPLVKIYYPQALFAWIALGVVSIWVLPVFFKSFTQTDAFAALTFFAIFGICFLCVQDLVLNEHRYLWTLCFATYGSDSGAYFCGRFFGKHKMNERVSPKKTWEGFFGGWLIGMALSWGLSSFYAQELNYTLNIAICVLAPVFAELGDLCFSSFKREYKLKDFSNLLPGHGGVLDRVDSLLMNFILFGILSAVL